MSNNQTSRYFCSEVVTITRQGENVFWMIAELLVQVLVQDAYIEVQPEVER